MRKIFLIALGLLAVCTVRAAAKKVECTLTVSPRGGDSQVSKGGSGGLIRSVSSRSSNNTSKTITRNLKWLAEVRIRENRPEKLELKAYYIGEVDGGKSIKQLGAGTHPLELDKNGRASVELESPTTRLRKTRTTSSSSGNAGFRSTKKRISGERVTGCVLQLFADGEFVKGWASDSRWASAANKAPFSITELAQRKSGAIGLR